LVTAIGDWSPDGTRIAYVVPVEGAPVAQSDIYVVNADGSGRTNLTQNPEFLDREPAWSPDGSRIVFRRLNRSEASGYDLWVMDADGSNQERVLLMPGPQTAPSWLPDDRILFQASVPSVLDLANGGIVTELVNAEPGYFQFDPAWRPR
jgi:TolB protein